MTATEMLIDVMEDFGREGEGQAIIVVYTNENGDAVVRSNCGHTQAIGLAEYAKCFAMQVLLSQPSGEKEQ